MAGLTDDEKWQTANISCNKYAVIVSSRIYLLCIFDQDKIERQSRKRIQKCLRKTLTAGFVARVLIGNSWS